MIDLETTEVVSVYGFDLSGADLSHIVPALRPLAAPIDLFILDPANAMNHDEYDMEQTKASLVEFQQREAIVVNWETKIIEAGNARWMIMKALGKQWIAVTLVEDDQLTATRYGIAANATGRNSRWNWATLVALSDSMPEGVTIPGLTEALLREARDILDLEGITPPDLDQLKDEIGEPGEEDFWPVIRLKVPEETKDRFWTMMDDMPGDTEAEQFANLLAAVDVAAAVAVGDME